VEPLFLFAHGAGAPSTSTWMKAWTARLSTLGRVVPFDYPYMTAGKRMPDRLPKLIAAHGAALDAAAAKHRGPVVLIGKSMGSRVGCHLALERPEIAALICLGYPLQSPSKKVRDEVLYDLRQPVLFVSGTRDPLFPLWTFGAVQPKLSAANQLHLIMGGDHSLALTKTQQRRYGVSQEASDAAALDAIVRFLDRYGVRELRERQILR